MPDSTYQNRKENEKLFFGYVNQKDFHAMNQWIDENVSEDFINRSPALDVSTDREGLKEMFRLLIEAFPDIMFEIDDMIAEGDKMAFNGTARNRQGFQDRKCSHYHFFK